MIVQYYDLNESYQQQTILLQLYYLNSRVSLVSWKLGFRSQNNALVAKCFAQNYKKLQKINLKELKKKLLIISF